MDNRELFDNGPKLIKCDGCGRYFEEQMLKKCRACGNYFCPECRLTHDCREPAARETQPMIIRDYDNYSSSGQHGGSTPRNSTELEFIDADGSNIGNASLRWGRSFGSERHGGNGRQISFNDYTEPSIRDSDLKNYNSRPYGEERYSAPAPKRQAVRYPQQPYTPAPPTQDYSYPPQNYGYHPEEYSSPRQDRATPDRATPDLTDIPPRYAYNAPVIDATPVLAADELRCDDCGKIWKKSQLRRCKKCGAVLCPECREKHKCGKKRKTKAQHPESAGTRPDREQTPRKEKPPKKQSGKKGSKKTTVMLIIMLVLIVAIAVAVLMIKGFITPLSL